VVRFPAVRRPNGSATWGEQKPLRLFELARVRVRFDHVALTDLTHFRIFPRNLEPDFTHYLCEQRKENGNL
jgi:hypothetical protein